MATSTLGVPYFSLKSMGSVSHVPRLPTKRAVCLFNNLSNLICSSIANCVKNNLFYLSKYNVSYFSPRIVCTCLVGLCAGYDSFHLFKYALINVSSKCSQYIHRLKLIVANINHGCWEYLVRSITTCYGLVSKY